MTDLFFYGIIMNVFVYGSLNANYIKIVEGSNVLIELRFDFTALCLKKLIRALTKVFGFSLKVLSSIYEGQGYSIRKRFGYQIFRTKSRIFEEPNLF